MYRLFKYISGNKRYFDIESTGGLILASNNPLNYEFAKSAKTYTIKLLNTPNNAALTDNVFEKRQEYIIKHDVFLEFGLEVFPGILYLRNFSDTVCDSQFVSDFSIIIEELGNKNLKELDWTGLSHVLTQNNIMDSFEGNLLSANIIYDFCDRGNAYYMKTGRRGGLRRFHPGEIHPALKFKFVLEKILENYNVSYDLGASQGTLDSLYLIFSQSISRNSENWASAFSEEAIIDDGSELTRTGTIISSLSELTSVSQFGDFEGYSTSNLIYESPTSLLDHFTIPETGTYNVRTQFKGRFRVTSSEQLRYKDISIDLVIQRRTSSAGTFADYRRRNLYSDAEGFVTTIQNFPWSTISAGTDISILDTGMMQQSVGTQFRAFIRFTITFEQVQVPFVYSEYQIICTREGEDVFQNRTQLLVDTWEGYGYLSTIPSNHAVPDMRVRDFLTAFLTLFNAEMYISLLDKKIYFQNRQQGTIPTFDITLDVIEGTFKSVIGEEKSNFLLRYTRDSDDVGQMRVWGDNVGGIEVDFERRETSILEIPFSLSIAGGFRGLSGNTLQMHESTENPEYRTLWTQRLAIYGGTVDYNVTMMRRSNASLTGTIEAPLTKVSKFTSAQLDFSNPNSLYISNHKDTLESIDKSKVVEFDMIIQPNFLSSIRHLTGKDLRARFEIKGGRHEGVYQIISLSHKESDIFKAKAISTI